MLVAVTAAFGCVSCGKLPFCVSWVDPDEHYYVEFLDRAPAPEGTPDLTDPASCGPGRFLMDTGDVVPMRILDVGAGNTDCRWAGPLLTIPEVQIMPGSTHPGIGVQRDNNIGGLSTQLVITLPGGCQAGLMIAIEDASSGTGSAAAKSDHVLRRTVMSPADVCLPAEDSLPAYGACMDSWYVKITDSTGRVITKHPDGGI
jgi:hypothetical protein